MVAADLGPNGSRLPFAAFGSTWYDPAIRDRLFPSPGVLPLSPGSFFEVRAGIAVGSPLPELASCIQPEEDQNRPRDHQADA